MKKKSQKKRCVALCLLGASVVWTLLVRLVDVGEIGPNGTSVGLATLNGFVQDLVGVNMLLYTLTDYLSLIPITMALGFAVLALWQWVRRKRICRVDRSLLMLGGFYTVVMAVYVFFEVVVINYRPILINGVLEASYPSSTTVLVTCVMSTAAKQLGERIQNSRLKRCAVFVICLFTAFMLLGRIFSGVHWITDIIGGMLISVGFVLLYSSFTSLE